MIEITNSPNVYTSGIEIHKNNLQTLIGYVREMQAVESLKHLSTVKLAVVWCNDVHFQADIIRESLKTYCQKGANGYVDKCDEAANSKFRRKSEILYRNIYKLPVCLQQEVACFMQMVSSKMLR